MAKAKEILDVVEETLDEIEGGLDAIEQNRSLIMPVAIIAGVAGLVLGGLGGYQFAKRRLKPKYEDLANKEIAEAKAFYSTLHKNDFKTPADAVEALVPTEMVEAVEAISRYQGQDVTIEDVQEPLTGETEVVNIFDQIPEWDQDVQESMRSSLDVGVPYIICRDEFLAADPGYNQVTLTYYEGDDVLADEKDEPIQLIDDVVGEDNLTRFGFGSLDTHIVYIRNDRLDLDLEVTKSEGKFAHEVLGFEHSDRAGHRQRYRNERRQHKFRGDDE